MMPAITICRRKNERTSLMPSPSMFWNAIASSTCWVCGSCTNCSMPSTARTVAARWLCDDGPTVATTSNRAWLRSLAATTSPSTMVGFISSTDSISP